MSGEIVFNWADDKTELSPERQPPTSDLAAALARVAQLTAERDTLMDALAAMVHNATTTPSSDASRMAVMPYTVEYARGVLLTLRQAQKKSPFLEAGNQSGLHTQKGDGE